MKHIYFSGIGGTGIGPLSLIAKQAGYEVSGSDKQDSDYVNYLIKNGITEIHIGQNTEQISELHNRKPIDWIVYSSAVIKENSEHPELKFAENNNIRVSKRDELLSEILEQTGQKLIAVAGTHGKTTTTAMLIWAFKRLSIPVSYSVGAKLGFGEMGEFDKNADYFLYEADEYDRNFLSFHPKIAVIPGVAYDHPDVYPTEQNYIDAFKQFVSQCEIVVAHPETSKKLDIDSRKLETNSSDVDLLGLVNRQNAQLVIEAMRVVSDVSHIEMIDIINAFPGVSRRFEKISDGIYSDYAHTPEKIAGAIQLAKELKPDNLVVVYEGLHNNRQHFIKKELKTLFSGIKKLYVVPSYLAREDEKLELYSPADLCQIMEQPINRKPSVLNNDLKTEIINHVAGGDIVLCLTAGGGGSLDEWLRESFKS